MVRAAAVGDISAAMMDIWKRLRHAIEQHGSAALVNVVGVAGSAPREVGARMVLTLDGSFSGTIGGGRLEYEALAVARAALAAGRRNAEFRDWPLGPNLGQCCGGAVTLLTETFDSSDLNAVRSLEAAERNGPFGTAGHLGGDGRMVREISLEYPTAMTNVKNAGQAQTSVLKEEFGKKRIPVLLFGAGHIGRALVLALAPLPFAVRWIDIRADQFPQFVPTNTTLVHANDPENEIDRAAHAAFVVVMTHSHPLDYAVTAKALQRPDFGFVGLIGSQTKRARFASQARQIGLSDADLKRLVCPIGLPEIRGKEPAVIAAAVAAQLLVAASSL